jgi:hypothetical protein
MNWIKRKLLELLAKKAGKKLFPEGGDGQVETKVWYKSKTILSAIVAGLIVIYNGIAPGLGWPSPIPEWIIAILSGIGIYSRVTANTTIQ